MATLRTRKRGNSWYYNFDGETLDGKRKIVEKGGFKTKKEALDAGTIAYASYKKGNIGIVSEKISCEDFLYNWLESKKKEIRATTYVNFRQRINRLLPYIGKISIQNLRPRNVDSAFSSLAGAGYSYSTLTSVLETLRNALDYAIYPCELLQVNPARFIKVPKRAPKGIVKRHIISKEKLEELLTDFPFGHTYHMPIIIAYHTGMRLGEVLGLCWDAVDFKNRKISVIRQLLIVETKGTLWGDPKTESSKREILMDSQLITLLQKWKKQQAQNELQMGAAYNHAYEAADGGLWQLSKSQDPPKEFTQRLLVCTKKDGRAIPRTSLTKILKARGLNFHSLRHTHATKLIENGAIPKDVASRLGHTDATITQNLYTHDTMEMQRNTVEIFENLIL